MKKGFTLLELLIVIGILAILATTATLVLNPAELLKQARDSQRLGDLRSVHAALSMYLATVSPPTFTATTTCTAATTTGPFNGAPNCVFNGNQGVGGSGWVNVNFSAMTGGSPLSKLPLDPVNDAASDLWYAFRNNTSANTWELDTNLESTKYSPEEGKDGGDKTQYYEIGTSLTL